MFAPGKLKWGSFYLTPLAKTAVSNESIDFAVFRILQEEGKTTGA